MDQVNEMKIVTGDVGEEKRQKEKGMSQVDGIRLPRVSIQFCTQCKWMLRAAYVCGFFVSLFVCLFACLFSFDFLDGGFLLRLVCFLWPFGHGGGVGYAWLSVPVVWRDGWLDDIGGCGVSSKCSCTYMSI